MYKNFEIHAFFSHSENLRESRQIITFKVSFPIGKMPNSLDYMLHIIFMKLRRGDQYKIIQCGFIYFRIKFELNTIMQGLDAVDLA